MEEIENNQIQTRPNFNIDGYCIRSANLAPDDCANLSAEVERIHKEFSELHAKFPHVKKISDWSVGNPHHASPLIYRWITSETNIQICRELIGENVDIYWTGTAHKPPLTGKSFPWHQDAGYGGGPADFFTCWTALDDVDEENGCFWVIPGSHRKPMAAHELKKSNEENYGGAFLVEPPSDQESAIPVRLRAGEMICFSSKLIHETRRNASPRKRRALIASYVDSFLLKGHELPTGVLEPMLRPAPRSRRGFAFD
jgi:phytanoyl-CoA hydroxylase